MSTKVPSQLTNAREAHQAIELRIRPADSGHIREHGLAAHFAVFVDCVPRVEGGKLLDQSRAQVRVKEIVYHDVPERLRRAPWRRGLRHRGGRYLARMRRPSAVGLMGIILWPTSTSVTIR